MSHSQSAKPKVFTSRTEGDGLGVADRQEGKSNDGLGERHVEEMEVNVGRRPLEAIRRRHQAKCRSEGEGGSEVERGAVWEVEAWLTLLNTGNGSSHNGHIYMWGGGMNDSLIARWMEGACNCRASKHPWGEAVRVSDSRTHKILSVVFTEAGDGLSLERLPKSLQRVGRCAHGIRGDCECPQPAEETAN